MERLLLLDDDYEGRREFFSISDLDKAKKLLRKWVLQHKSNEVFLYEVGPGIEQQIISGYDIFATKRTKKEKKTKKETKKVICDHDGYEIGPTEYYSDYDKNGQI